MAGEEVEDVEWCLLMDEVGLRERECVRVRVNEERECVCVCRERECRDESEE
jgi:hypothetical protein